MGIVISFGVQKGGAGKTTTTAISAFLLSQEARVLAIDFDSQGNLTQFLTRRDIYDFTGSTVLEALKKGDANPYIVEISERLHILPAEDLLATMPRWLYQSHYVEPAFVLRYMIDTVKDKYDYILIDLPPNLGDHTINGLAASDYAVVICQSEPFCYNALERYLETVHLVQQKLNPDLTLSGILISMIDSRASLDTTVAAEIQIEYEEFVFTPIIKRRARIKEFVVQGIRDLTKADREALLPYREFIEELKQRVNNKKG